MEKPKIIAYLKPTCGWSQGVRAVLRKYDLPYEDRDIANNPAQRQEMIEKTGQMLSPCVEVNGKMLPDVSGEEVEAYLLASALVSPNAQAPDAPTNQPAPTRCQPRRPAYDSRCNRPSREPRPRKERWRRISIRRYESEFRKSQLAAAWQF